MPRVKIRRNRLEVYPAGDALYKYYKTVEGAKLKDGVMTLPLDWCLAELLIAKTPGLAYTEEFGLWMRECRSPAYPIRQLEHIDFDRMHNYQHTGSQWLAGKQRALLADAPGLGKTVQAIAATETVRNALRKSLRVLVLCKNPFRHNWQKEIEDWSGKHATIIHAIGRRQKLNDYLEHGGGYLIVGWGTFRVFPELLDVKWDVVILDESHTIKNRKTKAFGMTKKLKTEYMFFLSATPFGIHAAEVWTTLNLIEPKLFRSYWRFFNTFVKTVQYGDFPQIIGDKHFGVHARVLSKYMMQRSAEMCIDVLPDLRIERIPVAMTTTQAQVYGRMNKEMITELEGRPLAAPTPLAKYTRLRQIASTTATLWDDDHSGKLDAVAEFVRDNPVNIIVASQYRDTVLAVRKRISESVGLIMGGLNNEVVQQEFNEGMHRVLAMTIGAGGESLNLQKADVLLILERPWSPMKQQQLEGRVYRPASGKQKLTRIIYLEHPRSIDSIVARKGIFREGLLVKHALELLKEHERRGNL